MRRRYAQVISRVSDNGFFSRINGLSLRYAGSLDFLLVLSGVYGIVKGLASSTWQHPVEAAQVLAGYVVYDPASLPYVYHTSVFSVLNHLTLAFLYLTQSEVAVSLLISALLGMLTMQTLAMAAYLIKRNAYAAVVIVAALVETNFFGIGISYPIFMFGTEHTYGRLGLLMSVMPVLFIAHNRPKTGFFLAGLSFGIHPAWGFWLNACLAFSLFVCRKAFRSIVTKKVVIAYAVGLGLPVAAYVIQKMSFPVPATPGPDDAELARRIFSNFVEYWDYHRQKFSDPVILAYGFLGSATTLCISMLYYRSAKQGITSGESLYAAFAATCAVVSWVFVFVPSWFDQSLFPDALIILMPGRFINTSIFLSTTILFAFLVSDARRSPPGNLALLALWVALILLQKHAAPYFYTRRDFQVLLAAFLYMAFRQAPLPQGLVQAARGVARFAILGALVVSPVGIVRACADAAHTNFTRLDIPADVQGYVLTTMERYMIQAESRVGSLAPHFDGYAYTGKDASLVGMDAFATQMYGISFAQAPRPGLTLHGSVFHTKDYRDLWEGRGCREWERLAGQYGFGLVLVPADMRLRLPGRDAADGKSRMYYPRCEK